jgi:hypothetical protein
MNRSVVVADQNLCTMEQLEKFIHRRATRQRNQSVALNELRQCFATWDVFLRPDHSQPIFGELLKNFLKNSRQPIQRIIPDG